ncbi:hypothetical protein HK099_003577 [Clydaea vesicula]|uniref:J domain-containing protein n=1 Tax=Clydaea vesicula TaxID=447962 RepID=A0AAD5XW88_9FUNG|nr:hypothetical protein HK099_003577 [Clydaea vesicula]KAJ3390496.1 hypothetical protein HDU92_000429 [Lobulomyces angularis]
MTSLTFLLPPRPKNVSAELDEIIHKKMEKLKLGKIEPIGLAFSRVARRKRLNRTIEEDEELQKALDEANEDNDADEEDEEETFELLNRDPLAWKEQDHYAVLGLSKKRWQATDEDIKRAYRRKLLKHHPDKKSQEGKGMDDSFFKCIQKAWEILSNEKLRKQFESIDPSFNDELPNPRSKEDFFELYGEAFKKTARFSINQPVPHIGDINSTKEEVDAFYSWWYQFESWRSFEGLDETEGDMDMKSREEKRWIEKKNKNARNKRKKEDNARNIKLVDQAIKFDPRILKLKNEEKEKKLQKIREKEEAAQKAQDLAAQKIREKEEEEKKILEEEKMKKLDLKKDKEMINRLKKKEKKLIKSSLKELIENKDDNIRLKHAVQLEKIFDVCKDLKKLEAFRIQLEKEGDNFNGLVKVLELNCKELAS